jgi:hypothetical protein
MLRAGVMLARLLRTGFTAGWKALFPADPSLTEKGCRHE